MLKTLTDSSTGDVFPGTEEIQELIQTGKLNDFCRDMVVRSLTRVWHICNSHSTMSAYRSLYSKALRELGQGNPDRVFYYTSLEKEDIEANFAWSEKES
jgi:hypothetical protein